MTELVVEKPAEKFGSLFKTTKYRQRIAQMALNASTSVIVDFEDILMVDPHLADMLLENPQEYLSYANSAALEQLRVEVSDYAEKIKEIGVTVRVRGLPRITPLRRLGSEHIGKLVMVEGIIMRASVVRPIVTKAVFRCRRCDTKVTVPQSGAFLEFPYKCAKQGCKGGPFEFIQEESKFIDYQELRMQEYPEDIPPGQTPRSLDIRVIGKDIVDTARPGDRVYVVGIVNAEATSYPRTGKSRAFTLYLDANYIEAASKEPESLLITPEEEEQIMKLAKDPHIHQKIIQSIAPSIYGYEHIKEAIMYLLFGGVPKHLPDITVRGDIHVLLIGDPGTAKSQLLRYVQRIAPRGLYTSGRGTTAAGLTAAVLPSPTGGMTLEA
ncbi:MAG: minichromosome maintenance protein MCM, partial [Candidatus Bathyarchaeia archaeon]